MWITRSLVALLDKPAVRPVNANWKGCEANRVSIRAVFLGKVDLVGLFDLDVGTHLLDDDRPDDANLLLAEMVGRGADPLPGGEVVQPFFDDGDAEVALVHEVEFGIEVDGFPLHGKLGGFDLEDDLDFFPLVLAGLVGLDP